VARAAIFLIERNDNHSDILGEAAREIKMSSVTRAVLSPIGCFSSYLDTAPFHALADVVHATPVHSAVHGILHWYCPTHHKKIERLALLQRLGK
jgi:hypothetical protein